MTPKLAPRQRAMLILSGFDPKDGNGFGVQLRSGADWRTARALERRGFGWIQGGQPNGSELPGMFFANREGTAITHPDDLETFYARGGYR
jgi:hypothetical protein